MSEQAALAMGRGYESCEECGAPLDLQQRYCVHCAARRGNGANPSSRYFAAASKRAHRPPVKAVGRPPSNSRAAAVGFFALLPIAVAIGVVVGRSGSDEGANEAVLEALRHQRTAVAASPTQAATAATTAARKSKAKEAQAVKGGGKVIAHTENGDVHQITGFEASKAKTEEDTHLVEGNVEQVGDNYVKAQQNLPDVIVVGGDPGSAPALPTGNEP
jgi:hypothetical protein